MRRLTQAQEIRLQQETSRIVKLWDASIKGKDSENNPCNRCREYSQYNIQNLETYLCTRCHDVVRDNWPGHFKQHCKNLSLELSYE